MEVFAYAAGMTPESFWDSTVREVLLMIKAHDQRELNEYRRLRLLRYDTYCLNTKEGDRVAIYEFMKLPGDPTPEEIAEMNLDAESQRQNELQDVYNAYKQAGII